MASWRRRPVCRHVTPHPPEGWLVMAPGAKRASKISVTQKQAGNAAREIMTSPGGGEVSGHRSDGRVHKADTVGGGRDLYSPRDKR